VKSPLTENSSGKRAVHAGQGVCDAAQHIVRLRLRFVVAVEIIKTNIDLILSYKIYNYQQHMYDNLCGLWLI
jgi:hypothetical protein